MWSIAIHGGAGSMRRDTLPADQEAATRAGLAAALAAGSAVLAGGGAALDAVEAAVCVLEDDPAFNAGRGAVLTLEGGHSLDAAVMDGATRDAGAVSGLTTTRHPVRAARAAMERTPHVFLSGAAADAFARGCELEQVAPDWFGTPERRRQWVELSASGTFDSDMKYGTVGAVARDAGGGLAAATSTGGLTGKRWGRIGDSPVIGAGTWADGHVAVSATGSGEQFIRTAAAHEIAARVRLAGAAPEAAARAVMAEVGKLSGVGGVIVVGRDGAPLWHFTTPGMNRALATAAGERRVAVFGDE